MNDIDVKKIVESANQEISREVEMNDIIERLGTKITEEHWNMVHQYLNTKESASALEYVKELEKSLSI